MRVRVVFVVMLTVVLAWPTIGQVASAAVSSAPSITPTVIFGAHVEPTQGQSVPQAIQALEGSIGRSLAAIRVYDLWDQPFPDPDTTWMRDTGHALFLSVRAKTTKGKIVLFKDIANAQPGSAIYDQIMTWANAVKGFGAHVYFTFNHEPEAHASDPNGTAAEFIAAWRHVIDLFRADGVTNAEFVWIMTDYSFWRTDGKQAKYYFPGDAWIDDIAEDAYNWNDCRPGIDNGWKSLQQIADPMRKFGLLHPGKHLMLTEWGSVEDPSQAGRKGQWISDAAATLKSPGWESFDAALYFDSTHPGGYPACDWPLTSSASAMSAFAAMGADPYFQAVAPGVGDTTPPSVPGTPTGASHSPSTIDLSWAASTDDQAQSIIYRVYRDGGSNPVGQVTSASKTTVAYTDTGLVSGSTHTYQLDASDGVNVSAKSPSSAPITVQTSAAVFSDDFSNGFANWTAVVGLTVDASQGGTAPPSAAARVSSARASAYHVFAKAYPTLCATEAVKLVSVGSSFAVLLRVRTAADGPVARVFVNGSRTLMIKSDVSGTTANTGVTLTAGVWTTLELCTTVGTQGSLTLYRDGVKVVGPWTANLGTVQIGAVNIGDTAADTWSANLDDVVVTTAP